MSQVDLSIDEGPCEAACDPSGAPIRKEHWFNPGGSPFGPSLNTIASHELVLSRPGYRSDGW